MNLDKNNENDKEVNSAENTSEKEIAVSSAPAAAPKPRKAKKINTRNFRHGALALVLTIVFIAVVVVMNIVVGLISDRFNVSADLTDEGLFTIEESTENYLQSIDSDISITVLNSETDFESGGTNYKQINEILKKFENANSHITLDYIVLDQNPNYSAQFTGETIAANYIVIEGEKTGRHRIVSPYDYFSFNSEYLTYGRYIVEGSNIEQEAISAIMYVTNDDPVRVAFTEGYGEQDSSTLSTLLEKNGYEVETINLTNVSTVDTDIDYVIMFGPTLDVDNEQLAKLDQFLDNGGNFGKNVFYFASTAQPQTPNIDAFLADWGLQVGYSVIGQSDSSHIMSSMLGSYSHYQQILETEYAGTAYGSSLYMYGSDMRPVIQLWENGTRGSIEQEVVMTTYDNAFLYPLDADENWTADTAESGTFNDAVVAYRIHSTSQNVSRLAVFGSDMFAHSYFMGASNSINQTFFINMFNYISGKEEGITITPKSFAYTGFDYNEQQSNFLGIVLCIVVPIAVIVLGIIIWVRRRHR